MQHNKELRDLADEQILQLLKRVVTESHSHSETDEVARALLFFLVRVSNTWRSIRTLDKHTPDVEGPMVDAGTLLRAMFDAYLQADYISSDETLAMERAKDYFDFEHVERYKLIQKVIACDNPFVDKLKASARRSEGEKRAQEAYDRVKARYQVQPRRQGGRHTRSCRTRPNWYPGTLADIARSLGKSGEYDILVASLHACVHSSPIGLTSGPIGSRPHILSWASTIAARVARLSVEHNHIQLDDCDERILSALCRPYFY